MRSIHRMFLIFHTFVLLIFALGCGAGKGKVKLEVTRSFASSNNSFGGGLYVYGKNAQSGKEFSFALQQESSTSIELDFGSWEIRAIGWDNANEPLEGDVLCGGQVIDFRSENQSANIKVSGDECGYQYFSNLKILACQGLFLSTNPGSLISGSYLSSSSCPYLGPSFQNFEPVAEGIRVSLASKTLLGEISETLTTTCRNKTYGVFNSSYGENPNFWKLPSKIPVTIDFFEDTNCEIPIASYYYPQGIDHSLNREALGFDSVLYKNNGTGYSNVLALSPGISRRGTTPFFHQIPVFKKSDNTFHLSFPSVVINNEKKFYITSGPNYLKLPNIDCASFASRVTFSSGLSYISNSCFELEDEGDVIIGVISTSSQSSRTITVSNGTNSSTIYGVTLDERIFILKELKEILGYNLPTSEFSLLNSLADKMDEFNNDNHNGGRLGQVASMLSPQNIGGIFWDQTCSQTPLITAVKRMVSFYDFDEYKTYQLIYTNSPLEDEGMHRRILARRLLGARFKTEIVIDFNCGELVSGNTLKGRMEEQTEEEHGDFKRLILWESQTNGANFETYHLGEHNILGTHSSFSRAEKDPSSLVRVTTMNQNREVNATQANSFSSQYLISTGESVNSIYALSPLIPYSNDCSTTTRSDTSYKYLNMNDFNATPTAGTVTTFTPTCPVPKVEGFLLNYSELSPENMKTEVFTFEGSFETLGDNL